MVQSMPPNMADLSLQGCARTLVLVIERVVRPIYLESDLATENETSRAGTRRSMVRIATNSGWLFAKSSYSGISFPSGICKALATARSVRYDGLRRPLSMFCNVRSAMPAS